MKRSWISAVGVAAMLALAACNLPSAARDDAALTAASQAAVAAEQQLEVLAAGSSRSGAQAPGLTDPKAGPLLKTLFDTHALPATAPPFEKIDPLQKWLLALAKAGQVYMLAGTGVTDVSHLPSDPSFKVRLGENLIAYAPEIGGLLDAQNAVNRLELGSVAAHVGADPGRANLPGLDKIRGGTTQMIVGELQTLAAPSLTDDWRRTRMPGLIALCQAAAPLLNADQKALIGANARSVSVEIQDDAVRAQIIGIATSFGG